MGFLDCFLGPKKGLFRLNRALKKYGSAYYFLERDVSRYLKVATFLIQILIFELDNNKF
jgi:hypothetical protein